MTLVQLRHLVCLADLGSYVQASKALFLTQPALTRSIQSLEEEMGGRLFDRLGRRIELTALGREVLYRARQLVSDAEALKQTGKVMHAGLIGVMRMGLSSAPGALFSTPLMLYMAEHHPRLKVEISRGHTDVLLKQLQDQQLDGAIVDIRAMRPSSQLQVAQAFELATGFLVRKDHPLTRLDRAATLRDLQHYPIASTPLSNEVARILMSCYGPDANPDSLVTLRCDETLSIVELARCSDAIVLTAKGVAPDLVVLDVTPSLNATARFGLVTLSKRQEAPAMRILREQLAGWVAKLA
ncbi:LysR family transcriptional regulator [Limnohabitans sp. 2KL-3]|uniref:LysR family transcriptional regulator n=1 Tax=Limnohabitans sp. 2KL-3 TaxID=1100700 RepID=UPI000B20DACF|nr:LysR family transcriptional regulator [Limnohabitans sp. 2KL-3]